MNDLGLELEQAHKVLDNANIPRKSKKGECLDLPTRIKLLYLQKKLAFRIGIKRGAKIARNKE